MEKQLVEELNKTDKLSEMDEVSREMILARVYKFTKQLAQLVDSFTTEFHSLVDSEPELSKIIEPTLLLSYTEYIAVAQEPEDPVPVVLITGSSRLITLSLKNLANTVNQMTGDEGNDVQKETVQEG